MKKIHVYIVITSIIILGIVGFVLNGKYARPLADDAVRVCKKANMPYLNSKLSVNDRVKDLMSRMTEEEKIGQMILIEKNSISNLSDIKDYKIGALLSGGGAGPKEDTPLAWLKMINEFQSEAEKTCLGIPLLYGIDAVHGHGNVLGATIFPHSIGLGATRDEDLVRRVAKATAEEMSATGIYWSYSPNLDTAKDIRWGKTYETFGSDTENVSKLGLAYLQGLQDSSEKYFKVLSNPKHFVGGGSMEYGTSRNKNFKIEEGNITLSEEDLRKIHIAPFVTSINGGAKTIMVSTGSWQGKLNTANHYLLTDILKKEFKFDGFIVSDWYGVYSISSSKYDSTVTAINAGVDMMMSPFEYKGFISDMQKALVSGDIKKERLNDAVARILKVKFETGLFDRPKATVEGLSVIGNNEHRMVAREAVRKSQVLLKNESSALPIPISVAKIIVSGPSANNLGRQAGGWTTEWQGIDGNFGIKGTTVLEGIKSTVSKDTEVLFNAKGDFSKNNELADIGIAVVGEKPYAEGWGDKNDLRLSKEDLQVIAKTKEKSKKVVVVIISGRPLDITLNSKDWDAIVASWLPGSEGTGVADVLFGLYPFTGVLPLKWDI
jgi:beta-glucosidase